MAYDEITKILVKKLKYNKELIIFVYWVIKVSEIFQVNTV